jgi:hypothetical protein
MRKPRVKPWEPTRYIPRPAGARPYAEAIDESRLSGLVISFQGNPGLFALGYLILLLRSSPSTRLIPGIPPIAGAATPR